MKKFYLLLILSFSGTIIKAQPYAPMLDSISNIWYFSWNVMPVRLASSAPNCSYPLYPTSPSWTYSSVYDTSANGFTYKAIGKQNYGVPFLDCVAGYLREDTAARKIYFMDNLFGVEELLYDFSMQPGDSISLSFASQSFFQNGTYILDSIITVNLISGPHRMFCLSNPVNPQQWVQLQWIEGVGNPGNLLYNKAENFGGGVFNGCGTDPINRNSSDILTCFYHGPEKIYFDSCAQAFAYGQQGSQWFSYVDSCVYWNLGGSVEEINGLTAITASPNPAVEATVITIESTTALNGSLLIRDYLGREVYKTKSRFFEPGINRIDLSTRTLAAGIYMVVLQTDEGNSGIKLMVGSK